MERLTENRVLPALVDVSCAEVDDAILSLEENLWNMLMI
jgi:hypothetical protein